MQPGIIKHIIFCIGFIGLSLIGNSQCLNNRWIVGFEPYVYEFFPGQINYTEYVKTPTTSQYAFDAGASNIQDSSKLLFSCNGFYIFDNKGQLVENSSLSPMGFTNYCNNYGLLFQESIILPRTKSIYSVFSWGLSDSLFNLIQNGTVNWRYDILTYSTIDMNQNNGNGEMISNMNYLLKDDTLSACQMSAVKHANGRDWWLIKPHTYKHLFNEFLVTPDSIVKYPRQEFESPTFLNGVNGQSNFSLDGSLYALCATFTTEFTQVNYFDRCSGKMTKFKSIPRVFSNEFNDYIRISGVCFSPNNRFLYLINNVSITQYDLENDERIELIEDSIYNPAGNTVAYNAPDGRIYIGNYDATQSSMSYIEYPDKKGKEAKLCHLCMTAPNANVTIPPNLPNYELGPLVGSPCDTIGKLSYLNATIYPNPSNDFVHLYLPYPMNSTIEIGIYDMLGKRIILTNRLLDSKQEIQLEINYLAKGIYFLVLNCQGHLYKTKLDIN